jgi:DNA-binding CsgD family transcriptional regulator
MATIERAVDSFQEAALLPDLWPQALDVLAQEFGSRGISLILQSTTLNTLAVSTSIQPFVTSYMSWPAKDPREDRVNPAMHEGFMPDQAYFSSSEIAREPYYQEFLAPRGFGWNAVATLNGNLLISVKRGFSRPAYDGADLQILNATLPWLRSASRTACLTWHSGFKGQLNAFERLNRGAILIDRSGRVLEHNANATFGDGLDVTGGLLCATHPNSRTALQGLLSTILARSGNGKGRGATVAVARTSGRRPWLLDGIPCTDAVRSLHSRAAGLIIVTDLERTPRPAHEVLRLVFGLTRTEAALTEALIGGLSLREAAERLAISEGHARQRMLAIFGKTRTSRQGELIALLAKLF